MPNFKLLDIEKAYRDGSMSGWKPDPDFSRLNPLPLFTHAAPALSVSGKETFLYRALFDFVKNWRPQYQKRGTCVGQGAKLAADTLEAVFCKLENATWVGRASVAGMYAGSRVEIAGQPGRWDGSNGSWVAKYVEKYGMLMLKDIGLPEDAMDADEQLATKWAASREGIPSDFEAFAKKYPITQTARITNFDDAAAAIENGYCVVNCSNRIPSGRKDKDGFASASRGGGHCQIFWAVRYGNRPGCLQQNSWSASFASSGGKYPEDQPAGSVWHDVAEVNRILAQGDSFSFAGPGGFQKRKINFKLI